MGGRIAGILATLVFAAYTGFLAWRTGSPALMVIVAITLLLAVVNLWQTEFLRRENSIRRG